MAIAGIEAERAPRVATRLCGRQRELFERLVLLERDVRRMDDRLLGDFAEHALQRENDDMIDRLRALTEWELDQIDSALERIALGDYGACARCGQAIDAARLEILPHAALCASCAGPENS
jgi:RNA polymerase-binding transcription factor DksA